MQLNKSWRLKIIVANGPHRCVITKNMGTAPKPRELRKRAFAKILGVIHLSLLP